ncbi:MAG: type I secretion system permease/ATPase, partial [Pseudomonadota bacterium]
MNHLENAVDRLKKALVPVAIFSAAVNILMLTGPLFMLQVYDRVLTSRSSATLLALFAIVAVLYVFLAAFDGLRARILARAAHRFDGDLMETVQMRSIKAGLARNGEAERSVRDLTNVRQFIQSRAPVALFDLPWVPLYLGFVFFINVWLGLFTLFGMAMLACITYLTERSTKEPLAESGRLEAHEALLSNELNRNAEAVIAMGMAGPLTNRWISLRKNAMRTQRSAGDLTDTLGATSRGFRLFIQSAILALGAYLALLGHISAGMIIAASILTGRALSPIDQVTAHWKAFIRARLAFDRLKEFLGRNDNDATRNTRLPEVVGNLDVSQAYKLTNSDGGAGDQRIILGGLDFRLEPGDGLGVIGPSASGKSTLARLLVGITMPDRGAVRLDGATFDMWNRDELGRNIGYLPQNVHLVAGTIFENIARFEDDARDEDVVEAARLAGVHDLILRLDRGYKSEAGEYGGVLSGGQAQRIALARAVYRRPKLVVLDEPNA